MSSSKEEEDEEMDGIQDHRELSKVDMVGLMSCPAEDKVETGSGLKENTLPHKIEQETTPPKHQARTVMEETVHVTPPGQIARVSNDNCSLYSEGNNANMSQEEKSTFDFISEQLNIMNSHSGEIATSIHKSNKQLCQDKITKSHSESASVRSHSPFRLSLSPFLKRRKHDRIGMKGSSARKVSQKRSKKPRLETEDAKDRTPVVSDSSSEDASFSDGLEIQEDEFETELEQNLEMKARRNKLTAANVKSILLRVLTHEHVITMVRNNLREELANKETDENELPSEEYEPKMTRSKAKEVMENEKNILHPWTMSPLKKKTKNAPGFLELAFSEEEDDEDEEYNPEKDQDKIYSDEDTESILSSQTSELGSPCPSTPSTPHCSRTKDLECTSTSSMNGTDDEKRVTSPMGPPFGLPVLKQRYLMKEMEKSEQSLQDEEEAEEQIASRTRSKFPLTEKSLTELEANFMAPDITADMYNTECDDKEWKEFLFSIHKFEEKESPADQEDDEEGDPEYNYFEEEEVQDREDFRSDRAVRVSKKELNELMDEMIAVYGDDADGEADMVPASRTKPVTKCQTKSPISECGQSKSQDSSDSAELQLPQLTDDERKQLDEQMRKHVQLLTQTFIMAQGKQKNFEVAECAKVFLNELFNLGKTSAVFVPKTAYQACNLVEACAIVNNEELWKCESSPVKSPEKNRRCLIIKQGKRFQELLTSCFGISEAASPKPCLPNFSQKQTDIMWNSPVFMYHKLLPHGNFFFQSDRKKEKNRVKFVESEDNLLSLGLEQFQHLPLFLDLIKKFLLPCKTVEQIKIRIKNLSAKKAPDNAVKFYRKENRTPDFPRSIVNFEPWMMRSPKDQMFDPYNSPIWCLEYLYMHQRQSLARTQHEKRRRRGSINLPCNKTNLDDLTTEDDLPERPVSAPVVSLKESDKEELKPRTSRSTDSVQLQCGMSKRRRIASRRLNFQVHSSKEKKKFVPLLSSGINGLSGQSCPITVFVVDRNQINRTLEQQSPSLNSGATQRNSVSEDSQVVTSNLSANATFHASSQIPVSCVNPTIVVINSASNIMSAPQVQTLSPVSALQGSVMSTEENCKNTPNKDEVQDSEVVFDSPHTPQSQIINSAQSTPAAKLAVEIMASYAQYFISPNDRILQESTPVKARPRYRPVVPKPILSTPKKSVSPFLEKKDSPRRRELQRQAKAILPKGFVYSPHISPVKKVATNLKIKAAMHGVRGSPRLRNIVIGPQKILPKAPMIPLSTASGQKSDTQEVDEDCGSKNDTASEYDTLESISDEAMDADDIDNRNLNRNKNARTSNRKLQKRKSTAKSVQEVPSDETQSEEDGLVYDSQEDCMDDDDHLANLMAASTTIRFHPSKSTGTSDNSKANKNKRRQDTMINMLGEDVIETDPVKDERDTAFARAYLRKVKEALKGNLDDYEAFLKLLHEFDKSDQSPSELYKGVCKMLAGHPDLVSDFAGFLLPEQALECECYTANQEFVKARTFLRKLEINFQRNPSHFQKLMKSFWRWNKKNNRTLVELQTLIQPLLKGQKHLIEEFSCFFPEEQPLDSYMTDYEDVALGDSDEDGVGTGEVDQFETIEMADEAEEIYGTKHCPCSCHDGNANSNDYYISMKKHCYTCGLTVVDGELVCKVNKTTMKKVKVTFHPPICPKPSLSPPVQLQTIQEPVQLHSPDWTDSDTAEKENIEHFDTGTIQPENNKLRPLAGKKSPYKKKSFSKKFHSLKDKYSHKGTHFFHQHKHNKHLAHDGRHSSSANSSSSSGEGARKGADSSPGSSQSNTGDVDCTNFRDSQLGNNLNLQDRTSMSHAKEMEVESEKQEPEEISLGLNNGNNESFVERASNTAGKVSVNHAIKTWGVTESTDLNLLGSTLDARQMIKTDISMCPAVNSINAANQDVGCIRSIVTGRISPQTMENVPVELHGSDSKQFLSTESNSCLDILAKALKSARIEMSDSGASMDMSSFPLQFSESVFSTQPENFKEAQNSLPITVPASCTYSTASSLFAQVSDNVSSATYISEMCLPSSVSQSKPLKHEGPTVKPKVSSPARKLKRIRPIPVPVTHKSPMTVSVGNLERASPFELMHQMKSPDNSQGASPSSCSIIGSPYSGSSDYELSRSRLSSNQTSKINLHSNLRKQSMLSETQTTENSSSSQISPGGLDEIEVVSHPYSNIEDSVSLSLDRLAGVHDKIHGKFGSSEDQDSFRSTELSKCTKHTDNVKSPKEHLNEFSTNDSQPVHNECLKTRVLGESNCDPSATECSSDKLPVEVSDSEQTLIISRLQSPAGDGKSPSHLIDNSSFNKDTVDQCSKKNQNKMSQEINSFTINSDQRSEEATIITKDKLNVVVFGSGQSSYEPLQCTSGAYHDMTNVDQVALTTCTISQPKGNDQNSSNIEPSNKGTPVQETREWTRDLDRIILLGCKTLRPCQETFENIAQQLGNRNHKEVKERFHFLMAMAGCEDNEEQEGEEEDQVSSEEE
ncbi:hypothetical protein ACJMK2_044158 [Sinanodonta woodiana]|uniref:GON-4-like protein n=1 Tax=Sinanodonta woodiana TaxID=1069815 RepID=A0ABD3W2G7_SINWO